MGSGGSNTILCLPSETVISFIFEATTLPTFKQKKTVSQKKGGYGYKKELGQFPTLTFLL